MYFLTRAYTDCTSMSEHGDDIVAMLEAAAIYLRDRDCWAVSITDTKTGNLILQFYR